MGAFSAFIFIIGWLAAAAMITLATVDQALNWISVTDSLFFAPHLGSTLILPATVMIMGIGGWVLSRKDKD